MTGLVHTPRVAGIPRNGGRLQFGMVAGFKSESRQASNRNTRPECVGIRIGPSGYWESQWDFNGSLKAIASANCSVTLIVGNR